MNLMGGYAVVDKTDPANWKYASLRSSSSWASFSYGKKWQGVLFAGYVKTLGLAKAASAPLASSDVYFCSNGSSNINQLYRINPQLLYNFHKFTVGLEYQWTAVQYGTGALNEWAKVTTDLHWVGNHRVNMMVKFTF
jgi:hypothetical protein